jgi:hypothetical protein
MDVRSYRDSQVASISCDDMLVTVSITWISSFDSLKRTSFEHSLGEQAVPTGFKFKLEEGDIVMLYGTEVWKMR